MACGRLQATRLPWGCPPSPSTPHPSAGRLPSEALCPRSVLSRPLTAPALQPVRPWARCGLPSHRRGPGEQESFCPHTQRAAQLGLEKKGPRIGRQLAPLTAAGRRPWRAAPPPPACEGASRCPFGGETRIRAYKPRFRQVKAMLMEDKQDSVGICLQNCRWLGARMRSY